MRAARFHRVWPVFFAACLWTVWCAPAIAAEVTARTRLSEDRVVVGQELQLQIQISGVKGSVDAPPVNIDGLSVQYYGPSQSSQVQIENGRITSSHTLTHVYSVTPQRSGTFAIPSFSLAADGQVLRTNPVTLRVDPSSGQSGQGTGVNGQFGFAEFQVPKKTV